MRLTPPMFTTGLLMWFLPYSDDSFLPIRRKSPLTSQRFFITNCEFTLLYFTSYTPANTCVISDSGCLFSFMETGMAPGAQNESHDICSVSINDRTCAVSENLIGDISTIWHSVTWCIVCFTVADWFGGTCVHDPALCRQLKLDTHRGDASGGSTSSLSESQRSIAAALHDCKNMTVIWFHIRDGFLSFIFFVHCHRISVPRIPPSVTCWIK